MIETAPMYERLGRLGILISRGHRPPYKLLRETPGAYEDLHVLATRQLLCRKK